MMLVRAIGTNAALDLFDHYLVIHQNGSETFVPLAGIKSVQFSRPSFFKAGRLILSLEGVAKAKSGILNQSIVFFNEYQLHEFEQVLNTIRMAIATPSIEQLAMAAAARQRGGEYVGQSQRPPTPNRLERIDGPTDTWTGAVGGGHENAGGDSGRYYGGQEYRQQTYDRQGGQAGHSTEPPPLDPSMGGWWRDMPLLGKIILIAVVLFSLLVMCSSGSQVAPDASQGEDATTAATEAAQSDATDPAYDNIDGLPPIGQLVLDGDSRACSHPETLQTLRSIIFPATLQPDALGVSASELRRAIRAAKTVVSQVTLDDIQADIHEMSCSGTLDYGGGKTIPIEFTLKPAADQNGEVMVSLADQPHITQAVLDGPLTDIRNRRQMPPPPPGAASGNLEQQAVGISDDDRYAPH